MIFLTCNDAVNGIYEGQVLDVARFLRSEFDLPVRLLAMFPRSWFEEEAKALLKADPGAIAISSRFPLRFYGWNTAGLLPYLKGEHVIWARGVLACELALRLKKKGKIKKVIYDGRGAVAEEFREYISSAHFSRIYAMEKRAVMNADLRIAVSAALVDHWRKTFGYHNEKHLVIPTTLNTELPVPDLSVEIRSSVRKKFGFRDEDVIFVYSGGSADWQSFSLIGEFLAKMFALNANYKLLLLVKGSVPDLGIPKEFTTRVLKTEVRHDEIPGVLSACDHALLLREDSITNRVSAPTKFAEYLLSGLNVIISEHVGDYSTLLKEKRLGSVYSGDRFVLNSLSLSERKYLQDTALQYFSKRSPLIREKYSQLAEFCNA